MITQSYEQFWHKPTLYDFEKLILKKSSVIFLHINTNLTTFYHLMTTDWVQAF